MKVLRHFIDPLAQGIGVFALLAMLALVPYAIWQYRRHGRFAPRRALVNATFLLYLLCAWACVLLPLPDPSTLVKPAGTNLVPFQWVHDMLVAAGNSGVGWRSWLTNGPLLVRVFNVALTVPFGVYLRRWYRRSFLVTTLAGLGLSLAFELTQLTALWGLYPMAYRTFDVDDLIANTLGAALGWLLAPLVFLLPARHALDDVPVTGLASPARRLVALFVDGVCWALAYLAALGITTTLADGLEYRPQVVAVVLWTLTFLLVFVAVPALAAGATPGRALLELGVVRSGDGRAGAWRYLVREVVLLWPLAVVPAFAPWVDSLFPEESGRTLAIVFGLPFAWMVLLGVVALLRADRRSLPDLLAGTKVVAG